MGEVVPPKGPEDLIQIVDLKKKPGAFVTSQDDVPF
jgi:hypothetical protein